MSDLAQPPLTADDLKCSRCEEKLDTTGFPRWCKACQNKYRRELRETRKEMQESRGYAAGVSAMREYLAREFEQRYGNQGSWTGSEIADIIRAARGPFDKEDRAAAMD